MPIFDHSASRPACAEANLPQRVLGLAKSELPVLPLSGNFAGGNDARA